MQIITKRKGSALHARLVGELDHHSATIIRQALDEQLTAEVGELVLDMREVSFMDSSGIGVILGRYKRLRERGGRLRIPAMSPYAERILRMAGILPLVAKAGRADHDR